MPRLGRRGVASGRRRGRVFHVSNAGSDAADGLTTATAWATAAKVNASSFLAGDSVLFQRGGVWRETLEVPRGDFRVGAYGGGAKPVFTGADLRASWTTEARPARENFLDGAGSTPHSYWALAETTGSRLDGKTPQNNDLTPGGANAVVRVAGPLATVPWAASFDGTNHLAATAASLSAGFPGKTTATGFTVGAWVNLVNYDGGVIAFTLAWALFYSFGRPRAVVWNGSGASSEIMADESGDGIGHWAHVAMRWTQGGELAMFVNGVKQAQTASVASMQGAGMDFRVGAHDFWGAVTGSIAEPFVFSEALTDAQLAAMAAAGLAGTAAHDIHHSPQDSYPENQVFRNGARLPPARNKRFLGPGQHWYDDLNGRLYLRDDPAGATIEVGARLAGIVATGRSDVRITGVAADKALRHGIDVSRGSARVAVSDCDLTYNGQHGYAALTRSGDAPMPDLSVEGCTAAHNGDCGIVAGSDVPRWRAANCTAHHNGTNPEGGAVTGNVIYTSRGLIGPRVDGYVEPPPGAVPIALNGDIQAAVTANAAGTAFVLAAGTWTAKFDIVPKTGNKFYGARATVPGTIATTIDGGGNTTSRFLNGIGIHGVVVANLRVRNYLFNGEGAHFGTNGDNTDWQFLNCDLQRCTHGLVPSTRVLVQDCRLNYNVSTGASGGYGNTDALFANNEISWNNAGREIRDVAISHASGIKIVPNAIDFGFRCNRVHHNVGANNTAGSGVWFDIGCTGSVVEGNTITDHFSAGLVVELDFAITVRDNHLARNGIELRNSDAANFYRGQLLVTNSIDGLYHNNDMVGAGGIWQVEYDRPTEPPYFTERNVSRDNLTFADRNRTGFTGSMAGVADGNVWTRNAYSLGSTVRFDAGDALSPVDFAGWQALGQDTYSSGTGGVLIPYAPVHIASRAVLPVPAAGVVIEDCVVWAGGYSTADAKVASGGGTGNGIWLDGAGAGSVVRRCRATGNVSAGVRISDLGASSGAVVERNIVAANGVGIAAHGSWGGATISRNTAHANAHNIWLSGRFGGGTTATASNTVRDNIAYQGSISNLTAVFGADNTGAGSSGNVYQRNALGTAAAGYAVWGWGNAVASYAALDMASGQTQANVAGDPLFVDTGTGDYALQAGSPCLGAATDGGNIGAL